MATPRTTINTAYILSLGQAALEQRIKSDRRMVGNYLLRIATIKEYLAWCDATKNQPRDHDMLMDALDQYNALVAETLAR